MDNWLERTELLLGAEKLALLKNAHVLVVGLGGVGAYAAEMIARAGVGRMTVADAAVFFSGKLCGNGIRFARLDMKLQRIVETVRIYKLGCFF